MKQVNQKKVFLSSTCYDLSAIRAEIESWANSHSFTTLLSNRSSFPVDPGIHRHDTCLANAMKADVLVLVVSARFGAPYYRDPGISITWAEYRTAVNSHVKIVGFVDQKVWDERAQYKYDRTSSPVYTKDQRIFDFLDEFQGHPDGHWLEIFETVDDVRNRLAHLTSLFEVAVPLPFQTPDVVREKYLILKSISPEAQAHVRLVIGDTVYAADDYQVFQSISAIPESTEERDEVAHELDGFTIYITKVGESRYLVRPTDSGARVRAELENASQYLYPS